MLKKTCRPVNATIFGSKTAFIIIGVMLLLNLAYSNVEAKSIVLFDKPIIKGVPTIIVPYGESKTIKLKNMKYADNGAVNVEVNKNGKEDFCLVLFFRADKEFLIAYLDSATDFTIHSSGTVLLGSVGHKLKESTSNGKVEYKIKSNVWNQYNMSGSKGTLYVFAVKGKVNPYSMMPGEQKDNTTYNTSSNVLNIDFAFK